MKSGKRSAFLCAIAILTGANQSQATETTTYSYDTLGRLVQSNVSGGPASGVQTATSYDPAGNRTNQTTVVVEYQRKFTKNHCEPNR